MFKAKMVHRCIHVLDLQKSLDFYEQALGLVELSSMGPEDQSWKNVYIGNNETDFTIELTWNNGHTVPYNNGDGTSTHLAFEVTNYEEAHALHESMGVIAHENKKMNLYFIEDPDGCWLEIISSK